jgi:hypothetical protein
MKPWTWRHAIIKSTLPPTTRHVLLTLACHLNDLGEDCFPSTLMLAEETGLSERSVCTHLAVAAERGWFVVRKHGYGKQKWARHEYLPRIPEGFEVPVPSEGGTEVRSAPSRKGKDKKALKDVQYPVDKGTEPASVPQKKALNVVPEGTEPNDKKALKDVQSNTAVNPSYNPAAAPREEPAAAAAQKIDNPQPATELELTDLLVALEAERGKTLTIDRSRDRVHVLTWVGKGVTPGQLREAHKLAAAARERDTDDRPTYAGFVAPFVDEVLAAQARGARPPAANSDGGWFESPEAVDARGAELGVRERKPDEDWRYYRVLVAKASREPRAIEFVLADAQRFNAIDLYQFARRTFGDALMPVDDYAS